MLNQALFSHKTVEHQTPKWLFDTLTSVYHFDLDAAASVENAQCSKFFTKEDDAFTKKWHEHGDYIWLNPPYGKDIGSWLGKAFIESLQGAVVICLLPARTDTKWFQHAAPRAEYVLFLKGRLKFENTASTAPFPSVIFAFGKTSHTAAEWETIKKLGSLFIASPALYSTPKTLKWCNDG